MRASGPPSWGARRQANSTRCDLLPDLLGVRDLDTMVVPDPSAQLSVVGLRPFSRHGEIRAHCSLSFALRAYVIATRLGHPPGHLAPAVLQPYSRVAAGLRVQLSQLSGGLPGTLSPASALLVYFAQSAKRIGLSAIRALIRLGASQPKRWLQVEISSSPGIPPGWMNVVYPTCVPWNTRWDWEFPARQRPGRDSVRILPPSPMLDKRLRTSSSSLRSALKQSLSRAISRSSPRTDNYTYPANGT
jgi:hypothetical protein